MIAPASPPPPLPKIPPSPPLLLLSPVCRPPFFILYFKGTKSEKGRNQQRQSSNSTYKHAGIIMGRPRRCHDNTRGGEGRMLGRWGGYSDTEEEMGEGGGRVAGNKERKRDGGCYLGCIYL